MVGQEWGWSDAGGAEFGENGDGYDAGGRYSIRECDSTDERKLKMK